VLGFIIRRLLVSIPLLLLASFVVFVLVASSGDPLAPLRSNPAISEATIQARAAELNLDKSIPERYGIWISGVIAGDLGTSSVTREPVTEILQRRMWVTVRLVGFATVLAVLAGVTIGVIAAIRQYSWFDHGATFFAFLFFSVPVFFMAAFLKDIGIRINEAVGRRIFFTVGEQTPRLDANWFGMWSDRIGHLILPALTLILIQMASWSRYQRSAMLETLNSDYVRTAKAKGLPQRKVMVNHALRNALIPVVTIVAIDFGAVIGGAVITETVFSWRGMGQLFVDSLFARDTDVLLGWLLVTSILVIFFNLIADILYGYLDPRIRRV